MQNFNQMHESSEVYDKGEDADAFNTSNVQGWRVKLYELEPPSKGGSWVDRGTGYVRVVNSTSQFDSEGVYNEKTFETQASLLVLDETAVDNILVNSPIKYNDAYERQGENIIMWRECSGDSTIDYALSFQESSGCQQIWKSIGTVQASTQGYGVEGHGEHLEDMGYMWSSETGMQMNLSGEYDSQSPQLGSGPRSHNGRILPPISELELDDSFADKMKFIIEKLHFPHPSMKEFLSAQLLEQDAAYISKLLQIFDCLEETQNLPLIIKMSELFRNILFLNDSSVLEYVVADPNILGDTESNAESRAHAQAQYMHQLDVFYAVAGTQEYDPTLRQHGDYRAFLREKSQCVEVVSMQQHNWKMFKVQQQAQFLFRLKYLKDIMLHPTVDDPYTSALSSMIVFTTSDICGQVFSESSYLAKVFQLILPDLEYSQYIPSTEPTARNAARKAHAAIGEENESIFATAGNKENIADGYDSDTTVAVDCKKGDGYDSDGTVIIGPLPLKEMVSEAAAAARHRREGGLGATIQRVVLAPSFINAIRFLRELFYMSKLLMMDKRQDMYRIFFQNMKQPFVEIVLYVLHLPHSKDKVRSEGASLSREDICTGVSLMVEIISTFTIVSPQFFRKMVLEGPVPPINPMSTTLTKHSSDEGKWKPRCLLFLLIDAIVTNRCDTDVATLEQLGEALKVSFENNPSSVVGGSVLGGNGLMAPNQRAGPAQSGTLSQTEKQDKDKFLCSVYDHYMTWFVAPLIQHTCGDEDSELPTGWFGLKAADYSSSHRILFDILIHCVQFHSYRMKYFMMRNNVIGKLVSNCFLPPASPSPSPSSSFPATREMQLNAIRFVKTIISAKDDFYFRHIVKLDVMKPIFHSFQQISSNRRDNLVSSSIYDLLFFVKTENIRVLICYIVENYSDCFRNLQFVDVFERLRIRYEQLMDNNGPSQANSSDNPGLGLVRSFTVSNSKKTKIKDLEEEEDYFFGEEETAELKPNLSPATEPAPAVAKKARIFDSKTTTSWSDSTIPAGAMRPAGQPLGKVVIFNRSNSLPLDRLCKTPEDLESGRKSAKSEGGSSGDRFSERRFMAAMKDSSAASAPPPPQSTVDISSLLSLYNDDDDEPANKSSEVDQNGEEGASESISALKFLSYKSVLSVPVHGDGQELPSADLNLLPRSTSASNAEKRPVFDIFADDDASVPDPPSIQTPTRDNSPHSSRPSVPESTGTASPVQQVDESPDLPELALPPLKPKFEASDDDVSPIFSNRPHGSPHHHHSSSNNSNNNSHSKSGKSVVLATIESDRAQEADSIAGKGLLKVGSVTFSIKKKPRIL